MTTYQSSDRYIHNEAKGCKIIHEYRVERAPKDSTSPVIIDKCETHDVELCRCGVEWGKHSEVIEHVRQERIKEKEPLYLGNFMRALKQSE